MSITESKQHDGATDTAAGGPSGVSLKAAWLLLRELRRYPALPSVTDLAVILDDVLNYEWAIRLIRFTAQAEEWDLGNTQGENAQQFNEWIEENLLR